MAPQCPVLLRLPERPWGAMHSLPAGMVSTLAGAGVPAAALTSGGACLTAVGSELTATSILDSKSHD